MREGTNVRWKRVPIRWVVGGSIRVVSGHPVLFFFGGRRFRGGFRRGCGAAPGTLFWPLGERAGGDRAGCRGRDARILGFRTLRIFHGMVLGNPRHGRLDTCHRVGAERATSFSRDMEPPGHTVRATVGPGVGIRLCRARRRRRDMAICLENTDLPIALSLVGREYGVCTVCSWSGLAVSCFRLFR